MSLSKAWSSKEIVKYFRSNRSTFDSLYKGEKYLLSKYVTKSFTILDIGCAQGGMYRILKNKFKNIDYTGVDFNRKMITLAKKKYPQTKFKKIGKEIRLKNRQRNTIKKIDKEIRLKK